MAGLDGRLVAGAATLVVLALGAGCGGGGGGGISVRANRSNVALAGEEHAPIIEERITFTLSEVPTQPVFVGAVHEGEGLYYTEILLYDTHAELRVVANTSLPPGRYAGTIVAVACWDTLCQQHLAGSPIRIPYTVELRARPALTRPPDQLVLVDAATVAAQLQGTGDIALNVGPARAWSASANAPWLVLDTPSGQTGTTLAWHIDLAALAALPVGVDQVATVTVSAPGTPPLDTRFQVTLRNRLPEVWFVGPGSLLAGRPGRAWLRGAGFDGVSDLALAGMVEGLGGAVVTRVNDGAARLDLPAAPAGSYPVRLGNALGLPRRSSAVRLVDPATYPAAVLPLAGEKGGLLHDPVRRALYYANLTDRTVHRLQFAGGTWTETSRPVAEVLELGLAPDGSLLAAASADGSIRRLDPDTLAEVDAVKPFGGISAFTLRLGLPVTGDGKVWLTVGGYGWNEVWTYDLATGALARPDFTGVSTSFYGGPWASVSRDGERLVMAQSGSISPAPSTLYLDASAGAFHANPVGLTFWYEASQSDDGRRLMIHGREVLDRSFAPVGSVTLPADTMARASILSPEGDRAYQLVASYYPGFPGALPARVLAYDTSTALGAGASLPVVGTIPVEHDVTCEVSECYGRAAGVVTPDGRTLFLIGNERLLVVPLP